MKYRIRVPLALVVSAAAVVAGLGNSASASTGAMQVAVARLAAYPTPVCTAGQTPLRPYQIVQTKTGATVYYYHDSGDSGFFTSTVPARDFNPLTASPEALAEANFSARPSSEAELGYWKASMSNYQGTVTPSLCQGSELITDISHTKQTQVQPSNTADEQTWAHKGSSNWGGWEYQGSNITAVSTSYTQNGVASGTPAGGNMGAWAGIGGDGGGLIQAGTNDKANTGNQAWTEWVGACGATENPVYQSGVSVNQSIHVSVTVNRTTGASVMQVTAGGTLVANQSKQFFPGTTCIGNSAEFIDEKQGGVPLAKYVTTNFTGAQVKIGATNYGISSLSGISIVTTNDGSAGGASCAADVVQYPTFPATNAMAIHWCRAS